MNIKYTHCVNCGKKLDYWQRKTCSDECRSIHRKKYKAELMAKTRKETKAATKEELEFKPWKPKEKPAPIFSDEEQRKIDDAVRNKYNITLKSKVYKKGTQEFEELAKKCIDPRYISKEQITYRINNV